jgi:hypothetical protein
VPGRRAQHDRPDRSVGRCVGLRAFDVRIRLRAFRSLRTQQRAYAIAALDLISTPHVAVQPDR